MPDSKATVGKGSTREELVDERARVAKQLAALRDADDGGTAPGRIDELEERLHELDALIDRIDVAVEIERQRDA